MKRLAFGFLLFLVGIWLCSLDDVRAQFGSCGSGFCETVKVAAAPSYTGPGDVVSGATAWYGFRAYNAAYATGANPAADVCDSGGTNCITINILSNGNFDTATASGATACGGNPCVSISKMYDQTGHANHILQATNASRPLLGFNCIGTFTCPQFTSSGLVLTSSTTISQAQPFTIASVFNSTSNPAGNEDIFGTTSTCGPGGIEAAPGPIYQMVVASFAAGPSIVAGTFQATVGVFNSASSTAVVDSTTATVNPGSTSISSAPISLGFAGCFSGAKFVGYVPEAGIWPGGFNSTQYGNMVSNQRAYWGF